MLKNIQYLILVIFFGGCVQAQDQPVNKSNLDEAVRVFVNDSELRNSLIGFFAVDTKTQKSVIEVNADYSLATASIMKVITTATAVLTLGENFTYSTKIEYDGELNKANGTLNGNIYIKGGGDPTLGSPRFHDSKFLKNWCDAISNMGIKQINGAIVGDAQVFEDATTPPGWSWADIGNYYGAGACGLSVYDNSYYVHFRSEEAGKLTTIFNIAPPIPGLVFQNFVLGSDINEDRAYIYGAPYSNDRVIRGTIPKNSSDFKIRGSIPDPALLVAQQLTDELTKKEIKIKDNPTTVRTLLIEGKYEAKSRQVITQTVSPELKSIVNLTNMHSINLYAEHLIKTIGWVQKKDGSLRQGIVSTTEFWKKKGMDTNGFLISDGSGLSKGNTVTARQFVFVLNAMLQDEKNFESFNQSLPVAGVSGTMKSFGNNTIMEKKLRAKSGTIDGVRSYAGYVETQSGKTVAFAVMVNNYTCSSSSVKNKIEKVLEVLCGI